MITRRRFLSLAALTAAAPAIVRASSLMPIKPVSEFLCAGRVVATARWPYALTEYDVARISTTDWSGCPLQHPARRALGLGL